MKKTVTEIQQILSKNKTDLAFILGNGINLHYQKDNVSGYKLLVDLWKEHAYEPLTEIPNGISYIEFYDALSLQNVTK
jgi:hypothetical protein